MPNNVDLLLFIVCFTDSVEFVGTTHCTFVVQMSMGQPLKPR